MWREYIQPVATIIALILSTMALVIANFPIESQKAKWTYVAAVTLLNLFAAGAVIYGTYHTLTKEAQEKAERIQIRKQLGTFIDTGQTVLSRITNLQDPGYANAANEWAQNVETYLKETLDESYIARFRSDAGILAGQPALDQERIGYWLGVRNRIIRLQQFSAELPH
jgi:hypothetical protein